MTDKASEVLLTLETTPVGDDAVIVRLAGEIDISSGHLLTSSLASLVTQGLSAIIIDATEVTFMDSTGLHALVEVKRILHENGSRIFLVPSPQVRRVLELVFPDPLFAARVDSVDEAMAALATDAAED